MSQSYEAGYQRHFIVPRIFCEHSTKCLSPGDEIFSYISTRRTLPFAYQNLFPRLERMIVI